MKSINGMHPTSLLGMAAVQAATIASRREIALNQKDPDIQYIAGNEITFTLLDSTDVASMLKKISEFGNQGFKVSLDAGNASQAKVDEFKSAAKLVGALNAAHNKAQAASQKAHTAEDLAKLHAAQEKRNRKAAKRL